MTDVHALSSVPDGLQPTPADPAVAAAGVGASLHTLDLGNVQDKTDLMRRFARDLALPGYFGHNWDALYDLLSDPDRMKAAAIRLEGWDDFRHRHHDLAASLESVLLDAQKELATAEIPLWLLV